MTSAQIDSQLRKFGYFLVRRRNVDGRWFVGSLANSDEYNCSNLDEVESLLHALRDKAASGGIIIHDGTDWVCVEAG